MSKCDVGLHGPTVFYLSLSDFDWISHAESTWVFFIKMTLLIHAHTRLMSNDVFARFIFAPARGSHGLLSKRKFDWLVAHPRHGLYILRNATSHGNLLSTLIVLPICAHEARLRAISQKVTRFPLSAFLTTHDYRVLS